MKKAPKRLIFSRLAYAGATLPALLLSGCSTISLFENDQDYLDYTTDNLYTSEEPVLAAAMPGNVPVVDDKLVFNVYAAAGLGVSHLEPNISGSQNIALNDKNAGAGQATLGIDINKHLSAELHSSDLGSAGFSPAGRINYHFNGISALYYAGKNRDKYKRRGFTGFARLGAAELKNSAIGNVNFTTNKTQVLFGAGMEYNTRSGIGIRGELISFNTDAQYAQLGLMYRFGKKKQNNLIAAAPQLSARRVTETLPEPTPVLASLPTVAANVPTDSDGDGVADNNDRCPSTLLLTTVDSNGCAVFSGTLEGVTFQPNSAILTDRAIDILAGVSYTLKQHPTANILVAAHTDSNGGENNNQLLSENRARAVVGFLSRQGISYSRMAAKAYGARKPIATNSTADGRARNRRVELYATQRAVR